MASVPEPRQYWAGIASGAAIGLVVGLLALDPGFITGRGGKWLGPEGDFNAYLVAWAYYLADGWRLPLFDLPAMGYPEGGSVLFNDALPLTALPTKIWYHLTGRTINPFGWWILATYVGQGAMAARLAAAVGARSIPATAGAAACAVLTVTFISRMAHVALSGHFLILWALSVYFEGVRAARPKVLESTILLAVALMVNSYLFAMVTAALLMAGVALAVRRQLQTRHVVAAALGLAVVFALALVAGYGVIITRPSTMRATGFGHFSWNLVGLLVPPDGPFGLFTGLSRDATGGQYEGDAYIGPGPLLLLVLCLVVRPAQVLASLRRHSVYVVMLVAFAVYAVSHRVYLADRLLLAVDLPPALVEMGSYFRATGRFIWPLAYSLTVLPLAGLFRWWRFGPACLATAIAVALQFNAALPPVQAARVASAAVVEDLIDAPRLQSWLGTHDRLWQYPSWQCGGLMGAARTFGGLDYNRELQVGGSLGARTSS